MLSEPRLERAIGVIYRPETERQSHYFEANLSRQFDAVIHLDETRALEPLERKALLSNHPLRRSVSIIRSKSLRSLRHIFQSRGRCLRTLTILKTRSSQGKNIIHSS